MLTKVLVPVDGSDHGLRAVRHVLGDGRRREALEVHLLNVRPRLPHHIARFVHRHDLAAWQGDQATAAMASACSLLAQSGVAHQSHWSVGDRTQAICDSARRIAAHRIVMDPGHDATVARRVRDATTVPLEVLAGPQASRWSRWGLPVGAMLGAGGLLLLALD